MAYYGNPETVRSLNRHLTSFVDANFDDLLAVYDDLATPEIESDLYSVFSAWPVADNGATKSVIASLWVYKVSIIANTFITSQNRQATKSSLVDSLQGMYDKLLEDMKSGRKNVPGATRTSQTPAATAFAKQRWVISEDNQPDEPEGVGDLFKGGLRR